MSARVYLNKDSKEYYLASNHQITIFISDDTNPHMLNQKGMELFDRIKVRLNNYDFTQIIIDYYPLLIASGMWINDFSSKYCTDNIKASINSFNNVRIYGLIKNTQDVIITSEVIMYSDSWCYTSGNHLYKLENKLTL